MSVKPSWLKRSHLFAAFLWNAVPPVVLLVAMLAGSLAVVRLSAIYGGQAWIQSTNRGAVPQVFGFVAEKGQQCAFNELHLSMSGCTVSAQPSGEVPHSPTRLLSAADLQRAELTLFGTTLDGADLRVTLATPEAVSGFAAAGDRLLQVSKAAGGDQLVVRDVTDEVLFRLSRAGAVEVELFSDRDAQPFATTLADADGQPLRAAGPRPTLELTTRTYAFDRPYRGYVSRLEEEEQLIGAQTSRLSAFARAYEPAALPGLPPVLCVVSVPEQVMLGYNTLFLSAALALGFLAVGWMIFAARRLTEQHLQPIVALSGRVQRLDLELRSDSSAAPELPQQATELDALHYAVSLLEDTIRQNQRLESRMRQSDRLESIGRLTGGIAHDFNNLLGIVLANCRFLREDVEDPEVLESVDDIEAAAQSAADMTASLLAFSAGKSREEVSVRDIAEDVRRAVDLISRSIGPVVDVQLTIEGRAPAVATSAQIQQLLLNLILNARDAAQGSRVRVGIKLGLASDDTPGPARWLLLSVSDDGVGMAPEVIEQIFDPFYTTKTDLSQRGTGLGLSVVYGIVEALGGRIEVHSEVGRGTRFQLFIPRSNQEPITASRRVELPLPAMSIVLVEDDPGVRRAVRSTLTRMGLSVRDFEGGAEVREWLQGASAADLDLLLTDIRMPEFDGYAVAAMCRDRFPTLPVLFMTGFDADAARREAIEGSLLLQKPLDRRALVDALRTLHRQAAGATA
jgi:signal transduction histidine kinase/ActR/RegA family two-component response regulator